MVSRKTVTGRRPPGHSVNADVELNSTNDIEVVQSDVKDVNQLAIDDEFDSGGDPYNSTGQFCIPAFRKKPQE